MGDIFNILFVFPITNVLVLFYKLFLSFGIPYALGFSIIALTIFIRLLLAPFVSAQIKSAAKMQKIAPHMSALREKHKNDNKKQQEELLKLYKEHGVNPASGCLPVLIQLPVVWSLYRVLTQIVSIQSTAALAKINAILYAPFLKIDKVWDTYFFGLSLSSTPAKLMASNPLILLVPVATGVFQLIFSAMMLPKEEKKPQVGGLQEKEKKQDDFQSVFQTQSLFIFPIMIGFFSQSLPIGLSLYWNTFTLFGILQQYRLQGAGRLGFFLEKTQGKIWNKR